LFETAVETSRQAPARRKEKGQVLIIVVFAIVALVAFIGLVVDLGMVYIKYGQLRRSVDAAALAASLQFREGYRDDDLRNAAREFLILNGIEDPEADVITCADSIDLCDLNGDSQISESEHRKFVQVIASTEVKLAFLPVIGIDKVPLTAEAVSEAASVDVVLAIDRSESMAFDGAEQDPSVCNAADLGAQFPGNCAPFHDVRVAAAAFVDNLFLDPDGPSGAQIGYDRVSVVTFDRHVHCSTCGTEDDLSLALTTDKNRILHVIRNLWVYQAGDDLLPGVDVGYDGSTCNDLGYGTTGYPTDGSVPSGPCRPYDPVSHVYMGRFDCPSYSVSPHDPSSCTTTNIGGGLLAAGNEFADPDNFREESLWVVIMLTDGSANSSTDTTNALPHGFCPDATKHTQPFCRDNEKVMVMGIPTYVNTRHCYDFDPTDEIDVNASCMDVVDPSWDFAGTVDNGANYDADDFAREMADWLAQNNVLAFTIGLGDLVTNNPSGDPNDGEELMQYVAGVTQAQYYAAPNANDLRAIFAKIADNIATRLTR
jgi:hypothetical protein